MKKIAIIFVILLLIFVPVAFADPFTDWFRGLFNNWLGITGKVTADQVSWKTGISSCSSIGCKAVSDMDCALCKAKFGADKSCLDNDQAYGPAFYEYGGSGDCKKGSADASRAWGNWYKACDCSTSTTPAQPITPVTQPSIPASSGNIVWKNNINSCSSIGCKAVSDMDCALCKQKYGTDKICETNDLSYGPAYYEGYACKAGSADASRNWGNWYKACDCSTTSAPTTCTNECSSTGLRQCKPGTNVTQVCGNYDADSCLEWGGDTNCLANQACQNGQCVNVTAQVIPSANPCDGVVCNDYCSGYTRYYNGVCVGGGCNYTRQENSSICGWQQPTNVNFNNTTCNESDGGKNYYIKGTTSNGFINVEDYCSGNILYEQYCLENGEIFQNFNYNCQSEGKICKDGACVSNITTTPANETCSTSLDGVCPVTCSVGVDADCCKNSGKFWLKTSFGYGCYNSYYNPGCYGNESCSNQIDGCCPNWCAAGSDADCCVIIGKNFVINEFGIYVCNESTNITGQTLQTSSQALTAQQVVSVPQQGAAQTGKAKEVTTTALSGGGLPEGERVFKNIDVLYINPFNPANWNRNQAGRLAFPKNPIIINYETLYRSDIVDFADEQGVKAELVITLSKSEEGCSKCSDVRSNDNWCIKCRAALMRDIANSKARGTGTIS